MKDRVRDLVLLSGFLALIYVTGLNQHEGEEKNDLSFEMQKSEMQMAGQVEKETAITEMEENKEMLSDVIAYMTADIQYSMKECERIGQNVKYVEEKDARLEIQKLLMKKENESSHMIYEKYFGLTQGELARIEGMEDLSTCGMFGFLNSHFGGVTFDIDDGILVQYGNDNMSQIWESAFPRAIIITGPEANIGFMDARAGMDFAQIQENAYEAEIQEGFMYFDDGIVYYIQYADEFYDYIFISDYEDGWDSWLVIEKRIRE